MNFLLKIFMKCFGILLLKEMKWGLLQEFKDLSAGSMRICSLLHLSWSTIENIVNLHWITEGYINTQLIITFS